MKLLFAGTPEFASTILEALLESEHEILAVLTQPDKPAGRGQKSHASPVKQLALSHSLPVLQPPTLKTPEIQQTLANFQPDLMIVAVYGLILPQAVLSMPRLGCLNVHASLLPRWRGASPIQQAILADDQDTGITLMKMDVGLDTGDMLDKVALPILASDTAATLHDKLATAGATLLINYLNAIDNNAITELSGEKQSDALSTHAPKIKKVDAEINWTNSAREIERAIRAYQPWPVCYGLLNEQTIRFWDARIIPETTSQPPGTIIKADSSGLFIQTAEGQLQATRLQLPGKKTCAFSDLYRGNATLFTPGTAFKIPS